MPKKRKDDLERKIMNSYLESYRNLLFTVSPVLVALALLILSAYFRDGPVPQVLGTFSFFIAGFFGVIVIIKREIPMVFDSITGVQAVVEGIIFTVACWAIFLYLLYVHSW
jgi:hypothetical protein